MTPEAKKALKDFNEIYTLCEAIAEDLTYVGDDDLLDFQKLIAKLSRGPLVSCALMDRRAAGRKWLKDLEAKAKRNAAADFASGRW